MAVMHASFCPRCDKEYLANAETMDEAKKKSRALVREHLVRKQNEDGLHQTHKDALENWDDE